ncbi:MAG TPA: alpha/beta hydrolase-fold protein [Polyangia bacterium]|jgi:predicted alpha/beta superfamily hydrolase|nr:alpha/beta hydrolase-fold protein [Polyangia bacterium]
MAQTTLEVHYPPERGTLGVRGNLLPLSWTYSLPPAERDGDKMMFRLDVPAGEILEFKLVRNDKDWSFGRNFSVQAGGTVSIHPYFDRSYGASEAEVRQIHSPQLGRDVRYRLFLPPSYFEHPENHYPVLYAQDGQALFADSPDPIDGHSWRVDDALNELYELGAAEEILVVGVYTDYERIDMLSPMPDPHYKGGGGGRYRDFITDTLKPFIDANFRTRPGRADTALMGASMGGLFSFWSAWTRPDVFGKAACLSSSFWWNGRALVREVQHGGCPFPPPLLYIDSGAAKNAFEEDSNLRDGYHHTAALRSALIGHCYEPGKNLHTLAFAGMSHNNASWAARVAIPLQLLFPPRR